MKKYFIVLIVLALVVSNIYGQSAVPGNGKVTGKVVDATNDSPIEYATVMLFSKQNSKMVTGFASNKKGEFQLKDIPNGEYYMTVTFVGYKKKVVNDIKITSDKPSVDLNEIKLQQQAIEVGEVETTAERSAVEFKIDKKVVNVSQNLAAAGGTAVDVLQNQPSVQVDANGNITLRGSSNFTVMVDGRPSVLSGTDALRQIPANIIDNIELITNPSAKYDAEGTAGIINIVTKRTDLTSTSGIFNSGIGSKDKYNGDFNLNYRTEDYNIVLGGDARRFNNLQDIDVNRTVFNLSDVNSTAVLHNKRDAYNARLSVDRFFNEKMTLGVNASYGYVEMGMGVNTINNITNTAGVPSVVNSTTNDKTSTTAEYFNGSVNFTNIFTPKVNDLYFEATFTTLKLPSEQMTIENSTSSSGVPQNLTRGRENNTSRIDSRIKLNYKHNLTPQNTFEAGLQANLFFKKMDIISKDYNSVDQAWIRNDAFSNEFDYRNNIYSAFATYTDQLLGLDYQAGLRLEYTDRVLNQITTKSDFKFQQLDLFPTLNISKKLSEFQQMQFSYSRRIQRPGDGQLNPFTYYSDSYTYTGGNPYLRPSFTHSVELNYQHYFTGASLIVQTYFRKTTDGIEQIQLVDNSGKLGVNFANSLNTTSIGTEISSNIAFTQWFRIDPAVNVYNLNLTEKPEYGIKEQNYFTWDARLNSTLMLSAETRIQLFANYFPDRISSQGEMKSFMIVGCSVRQDFFERKLIATFSAQNLFGLTKFNMIANGADFNSSFNVRPEAPVFNISISYNFNNFKRRNTEQVDLNLNQGL